MQRSLTYYPEGTLFAQALPEKLNVRALNQKEEEEKQKKEQTHLSNRYDS